MNHATIKRYARLRRVAAAYGFAVTENGARRNAERQYTLHRNGHPPLTHHDMSVLEDAVGVPQTVAYALDRQAAQLLQTISAFADGMACGSNRKAHQMLVSEGAAVTRHGRVHVTELGRKILEHLTGWGDI